MSAQNSLFKPSDRMLRQFAGLWLVFFSVSSAWQEFHHHRHQFAIVVGVLAVTVGPLGLVWPRAVKPVFVGWMRLAYPIGWVVSRIVLGVVFYGLFTPAAWVFRLQGRDILLLRSKPAASTYWQQKPGVADKAEYFRQF